MFHSLRRRAAGADVAKLSADRSLLVLKIPRTLLSSSSDGLELQSRFEGSNEGDWGAPDFPEVEMQAADLEAILRAIAQATQRAKSWG